MHALYSVNKQSFSEKFQARYVGKDATESLKSKESSSSSLPRKRHFVFPISGEIFNLPVFNEKQRRRLLHRMKITFVTGRLQHSFVSADGDILQRILVNNTCIAILVKYTFVHVT